MFYAAMIAAAFALDDPLRIVEAGLAEIPATSRIFASVRKTVEICKQHRFCPERIDQVHEAIYAALGGDDCSTPSNVAVVVAGLLMGGHDFEKVIAFTVMGGLDCDSTAATSGSIAGAMLGAKRLPDKWIKPLHDTLYGQIVGYHPIAISECARRSVEIAMKTLEIDCIEKSSLQLPRDCVVFGPIEPDEPVLKKSGLAVLPKSLTIRGKILKPRKMKLDAQGGIDLAGVIGTTGLAADRIGAYVFIPFRAARNEQTMFGFGADWWFTAYLDGKQIATSEPGGNGASPPKVNHFLSPSLDIAKGPHLLTIHFRSGTGGSLLMVGGPKDLKKSFNPQSI